MKVTYNLGHGHVLQAVPSKSIIIWRHPGPGGTWCHGQMQGDGAPNHKIVNGSVGNLAQVTITPSLICNTCGAHGWVRDGVWIPA